MMITGAPSFAIDTFSSSSSNLSLIPVAIAPVPWN